MAADTKIQWCDMTFNCWSGCTKVNAGCTNCYAEVNYSVKMRGVKWGPHGTRVLASDAMWKEPVKWNKAAHIAGLRPEADGHRNRRVFCASLADVFEDWKGPILNSKDERLTVGPHGEYVGIDAEAQAKLERGELRQTESRWLTMNDLRRDLFALIDATPNLDWLLLTKRPENIKKMWPPVAGLPGAKAKMPGFGPPSGGVPHSRKNVWLGTSVSDQKTADLAIPELLKCRDLAPVLFVSHEPALGPVNFNQWLPRRMALSEIPGSALNDGATEGRTSGLGWLICGGESGQHARPCQLEWFADVIRQCERAGVPCFFKQAGSNPQMDYYSRDDGDIREWGLEHMKAVLWPGGGEHEPHDGQPLLGSKIALKLVDRKGGDLSELPEKLRIRQFPTLAEVHR